MDNLMKSLIWPANISDHEFIIISAKCMVSFIALLKLKSRDYVLLML